MRENHLINIIDPKTNEKLKLRVFERQWCYIMAWELYSSKNIYPLIDWIPRLLVDEMKIFLLQSHYMFFNDFKDNLSDKLCKEWQKAIDQIKDMDAFIYHQKKTAESFAFEWNNIYKENDFEMNNYLHFLWWYKTQEDIKWKIIFDVQGITIIWAD